MNLTYLSGGSSTCSHGSMSRVPPGSSRLTEAWIQEPRSEVEIGRCWIVEGEMRSDEKLGMRGLNVRKCDSNPITNSD